VRTIIRRVARLEDRIAPREVREEEKRIMQLAAELRERRRRRLAAMGLPFEETPLPPDCPGPPYDLAKVLRIAIYEAGSSPGFQESNLRLTIEFASTASAAGPPEMRHELWAILIDIVPATALLLLLLAIVARWEKQRKGSGLRRSEPRRETCHPNPDPGKNMGIARPSACMGCHKTVKASGVVSWFSQEEMQ
jgi:hypothetical protein